MTDKAMYRYRIELDGGRTVQVDDERPELSRELSTTAAYYAEIKLEELDEGDPAQELIGDLKTWFSGRMGRVVLSNTREAAEESRFEEVESAIRQQLEKRMEEEGVDEEEWEYMLDDMLGEAVSLHRAYPRAVLGYLFMMARADESQATQKKTAANGGLTPERLEELRLEGDCWFEQLVASVNLAGGREGEDDEPERFEVVSCAQVDFTTVPFTIRNHPAAPSPDAFFDALVVKHRARFG